MISEADVDLLMVAIDEVGTEMSMEPDEVDVEMLRVPLDDEDWDMLTVEEDGVEVDLLMVPTTVEANLLLVDGPGFDVDTRFAVPVDNKVFEGPVDNTGFEAPAGLCISGCVFTGIGAGTRTMICFIGT